MARLFIAVGGVFGMLSVMLGAFGAHALKQRLAVEQLTTFETGVRYQMYHALALVLVGIIASNRAGGLLNAAGGCMIAGTLLFSGSLYALALGGPRWFGPITPLGGLAFIAGWALLVASALRT